MPTAAYLRVEGVDRLLARLGEVEHSGVRRVMLRALKPGADILRASIAAAAPPAEGGGAIRRAVAWRTKRQAAAAATSGNLAASVTSKPSRKATAERSLAYMVGPYGRGSAHRHLVIDGHEMVGHRPGLVRTGVMTQPNPFVERAASDAQARAFAAVEAAAARLLPGVTGP